ncbi:hypothetical protein [Metapseudomonas sp. CR1201]
MLSAYFLIVLYVNSDSAVMTSVPMETEAQCQQAAAKVKADIEGTLTLVKTSCVRAQQ